jgi:acyl-CoA thioesterase FadM
MFEEKEFKIENAVGRDVKEMRLRFKLNCEDPHYSSYMLSAPQVLSYVADAVTDFSVRRENGDGSLLVNMNGNFHNSLYGNDTIEVIIWLEKEGKTSRVYGFKVYKIVHFDQVTHYFKVLEKPLLISSGTTVSVIGVPHEYE